MLGEKIVNDNNFFQPLDNKGWSAHYNIENLNNVVNSVESCKVSVWSEELVKICPEGSSTLEIGCGSGASSLWLAKNGRMVSALDYTESSVELVRVAAEKLKLTNINVVQADATKDLPFEEKQLFSTEIS